MDDMQCDVDKGTVNVESVTVTWRGRTFIVDLCENETAIVEQWEKAGSGKPRKRAAGHLKPVTHSVTPID